MTSASGHSRRLLRVLLCFVSIPLFSCSPEKPISSDPGFSWITDAAAAGTSAPGSVGTSGAGTGIGSGAAGSPGFGQSIGNGGTAAVSTVNEMEKCAGVNVQVSRIKPWMLFVIDRSGSTEWEYSGSTSRWQALYDALMAPNSGVIAKLQSQAYFGVVLYDGGDQNDVNTILCLINPNDPSCQDTGTSTCPRLITVAPALNNYTAIDTAYKPAGPGSSTPTALALAHAYSLVPSQQQVLDKKIGPQYVVLCTDGEPNGCENTSSGTSTGEEYDFQGPIDEVTKAAVNGIETFVVGIAVETAAQNHLSQLATIGATGSSVFTPAGKDDLVNAITQIVGGAIGCKVELNGTVTQGKECSGYVNLNSQKLTCNDPNGWKLVDKNHIELLGSACQTFLSDTAAILDAGFPCDAFALE
jgi:hypothetical protein